MVQHIPCDYILLAAQAMTIPSQKISQVCIATFNRRISYKQKVNNMLHWVLLVHLSNCTPLGELNTPLIIVPFQVSVVL